MLKHIYELPIDQIVTQAHNGQEALEIITNDIEANKYKKCSYSLLFMDCNMPIMDGYTAASKIR